MTPVFAAVEWGGEFEGALDPISHLFEFPPIWELSLFGIDLSINRTILIAWFMTAVCGTLFVVGLRNPKVVPGKLQTALEGIVDFVRQIAIDIIGPKGLKFVPLLTTMFVFIFFMNVAKITPFLMLPPTSRLAWPLFLAVLAWLVFVGVGIKEQGLVGYFKEMAFPPGVPWPLYLLLTPLELVSNLILRPFTLMVRLFANMVAGHMILAVLFIGSSVFVAGNVLGKIGYVAPFGLGIALMGLELFVIFMQAFIFTILTAVYISGALHPEH